MNQVVDIRELNARIEQKSAFVDVLTMGMEISSTFTKCLIC